MADVIYQIKITLQGTYPPIWRRIAVPATGPLARLRNPINLAMRWQHSHPWRWEWPPDGDGTPPRTAAATDLWPFEGDTDNYEHEDDIQLVDALPEVGARLIYTFNLEADWRHAIELERIDPAPANAPTFICLGGERSAPRETTADDDPEGPVVSTDPDGTPIREAPRPYDPEAFSAEELNLRASIEVLKMTDPRGLRWIVRDVFMNVMD